MSQRSSANATPNNSLAVPAADEVFSKDWRRLLAGYRAPDHTRSVIEIIATIGPFVGFWVLAYLAIKVSYFLALLLCIPAGAFLVRVFLIQHDCGHHALFKNTAVNNWVGRALGVLTATPYDVWRTSHAMHHTTSGNLDHRGNGDITTLTVAEYQALTPMRRLQYRAYRHPIVMFGIGPAYVFLVKHRLPLFEMRGKTSWFSVLGTNAGMAVVGGILAYFLGWREFLFVQLAVTIIAATLGVWLFYVQHQFEEAFWEKHENWKLQDAALRGSSHYALPAFLPWLTAHIGVHHVHHLASKIPFYRLPQILRDYPELADVRRITIRESFACVKLKLWDEQRQRLVSFADVKLQPA